MPIKETSTPIKLNGISLIVEQGFSQEKTPLPDDEYTRAKLLQSLADQWIPLLECHKCGRFSYCKFAQPYPNDPQRGREIQCGVVLTALDNLLMVSWEKLPTYDAKLIQDFFDGAFYFVQFVYGIEVTIGNYLSRDYLDWAGEDLARKDFGFIAHLRVYLDKFAFAFKDLSDFGTLGRWLSVEGEAEQAFIKRLGELRFYTVYVGGVESYGGKGNAKPSKMELYLKSHQSRGYTVAIQGDKDGSKTSPLSEVVNKGLVESKLAFPFSKDFEGSFPIPVLHQALEETGYNVSLEWLAGVTASSVHPPVVRMIESKIGRSVNKVELAIALAEVVSHNWSKIYEKYRESEIVKWLVFLRTGSAL